MDRRGFLATLIGAAAVLDLERELWIPGKRMISIPKASPKLVQQFVLVCDTTGFNVAYGYGAALPYDPTRFVDVKPISPSSLSIRCSR
jgi:hypothetical protein